MLYTLNKLISFSLICDCSSFMLLWTIIPHSFPNWQTVAYIISLGKSNVYWTVNKYHLYYDDIKLWQDDLINRLNYFSFWCTFLQFTSYLMSTIENKRSLLWSLCEKLDLICTEWLIINFSCFWISLSLHEEVAINWPIQNVCSIGLEIENQRMSISYFLIDVDLEISDIIGLYAAHHIV